MNGSGYFMSLLTHNGHSKRSICATVDWAVNHGGDQSAILLRFPPFKCTLGGQCGTRAVNEDPTFDDDSLLRRFMPSQGC